MFSSEQLLCKFQFCVTVCRNGSCLCLSGFSIAVCVTRRINHKLPPYLFPYISFESKLIQNGRNYKFGDVSKK